LAYLEDTRGAGPARELFIDLSLRVNTSDLPPSERRLLVDAIRLGLERKEELESWLGAYSADGRRARSFADPAIRYARALRPGET
jgi:hypothetical protein